MPHAFFGIFILFINILRRARYKKNMNIRDRYKVLNL